MSTTYVQEIASLLASMNKKMQKFSGSLYIAVDGIDGTGKSKLVERLFDELSASISATHAGNGCVVDKLIKIREPGGTEIGEIIRNTLLLAGFDNMDRRTQTLLFMAVRAQLVQEVIIPALADNKIILSDRSVASTFAYQWDGTPENAMDIDGIYHYASPCRKSRPDMYILLDADAETCLRRIDAMGRKLNVIERAESFETRRLRYFQFVTMIAKTPFYVIDAARPADAVYQAAIDAISDFLSSAAK